MGKPKTDPPDEGALDSMCTTYLTGFIIAVTMANTHMVLSVPNTVVSTLHKLNNSIQILIAF